MYLAALRRRRPDNEGFPWNVPVVAALDALEFHTPVTFFVGENGSGKSTVLVLLTRPMRAYTLHVRRLLSDGLGEAFRVVERVGLTLPGVERATRYDGATVLRVGGVFMAGLATHASAEPESLVVKVDPADRAGFLEDAPETYYVTEFYRPHPVVLVRLSRIERGALRDLLAMSLRFASQKARGRRSRR